MTNKKKKATTTTPSQQQQQPKPTTTTRLTLSSIEYLEGVGEEHKIAANFFFFCVLLYFKLVRPTRLNSTDRLFPFNK